VFEGDTPMKVLMQHVQSEPLPPSARTELPISQEIDDLVLACLRKDPDSRPQNAEEVLRLCYRCHAAWDQQAARTWWEQHLPELTGPLAMVQTVEA
jgi:serine/threonine protein kinase